MTRHLGESKVMTQKSSPKSFEIAVRHRLADRAARRARRFGHDESGVMIAYSIFFLLIMLIVGGIGVDFMHYEMSRTKLQNTLDRAVLAAADLQQTQDPVTVVEDYLAKAGVDATLTSTPVVNTGLNYRDVTASATLTVPTQFIHMLGFNSLTAPGTSKAEEKIEGIEVVMVLDISGSMNHNNRLVNLKPAAREFIDTVMNMTGPGDVTISIVPYNTQVNAGAKLLSHYTVSNEHSYSNCVDFDATDFDSSALSPAQALRRTSHFDVFTYSEGPDQTDTLSIPVCPTWNGTEATVMSTDATLLKNRVSALSANGNTSIDVGMKWAAALLDPGTQPVITQMIADGDVSAENAGRPVAYGEPDVLKVIVVMTDGQNTTQYQMPDDMRSGPTDVYYNTTATDADLSDRYSIWNSAQSAYFWVRDNQYHPQPYGDGTGDARQLTYQQLSAMNSQATIARDIFTPMIGNSAAWDQWYNSVRDGAQNVVDTVKNARLQSICSAVKDNNVVIYAIGFEATATGNTQLSQCASSPSHFFDANGTDISAAFQAIAVSIAQLRLTQ